MNDVELVIQNEDHIENLSELLDQEMNKHYEENFIAGLDRAKEIIIHYFESI